MTQVTSEKQYLEKANRHLENILEATHAYKKQEVSELNRIHVETIKVSEPEKLNPGHFAAMKSRWLNNFFLILFTEKPSLTSDSHHAHQSVQPAVAPRPPVQP